ncbi:hypothetical protein ABT160_40055 [Streptomyces sp. NPDC001941]|uniref:hypothetical protein n=1 Tax=Streptomyces sp. NPDC001941 TaxID=3154659 RepID=UPI00332B2D4D
MTTSAIPGPATSATPIYELLVRERGDVLAESRRAAESAHAEARRALDWTSVRGRSAGGAGDAFSTFSAFDRRPPRDGNDAGGYGTGGYGTGR